MDVLSKTRDGLKQKAGLGRQPSGLEAATPQALAGSGVLGYPGKRGDCLMGTETANLGCSCLFAGRGRQRSRLALSLAQLYTTDFEMTVPRVA